MGKYSDLNNEVMSLCRTDRDTIVALRQICWNLAYIADELAEANRINSQTIGDICKTIDMSVGLPPEKEAPGLKADVKHDSLGSGDNCFICGGALDYEKIGGVMIDGDGTTYCACERCRKKFSNMLSTILLPDEMYF